jgi:hypothetical protein
MIWLPSGVKAEHYCREVSSEVTTGATELQ